VIVDLDGVRQAVLRGDGAPIHSMDNAYYKAYTVASVGLVRKEDKHQGHRGQDGEEPAEQRADDPAAQRHYAQGARRQSSRRPDDRRTRRERRPGRPSSTRSAPGRPRQDQGQDEIEADGGWLVSRELAGEGRRRETSAIFEPASAPAAGARSSSARTAPAAYGRPRDARVTEQLR